MGSQIYNHERCYGLFKPTNWMGMGTITSRVLSFGENVFILALQQHICLFSHSYFQQDLSESSFSSFTHNVVHVPFNSSFSILTYDGFHVFVSIFPLVIPLLQVVLPIVMPLHTTYIHVLPPYQSNSYPFYHFHAHGLWCKSKCRAP